MDEIVEMVKEKALDKEQKNVMQNSTGEQFWNK